MSNPPLPPRWADRLLESLCAPHLLEEVQGDLHELYHLWADEHGEWKARWLYTFHVIKFFRPFALKRSKDTPTLNQTIMFKNYLKVGLRNILKYRVFSFINVFGLAVAMSVCMLIMLMLADQKSYDQFHAKKDRIYRIISEPANTRNSYATTSVPLAPTLESDYPVVEAATQLVQGVGGEAIYNQRLAELHGYFADSAFLRVFEYQLEQGNSETALTNPNSIVITHALASQLFGREDPLGKAVALFEGKVPLPGEGEASDSLGQYTVTGVITSRPYKSHLKFNVLVSAASLPRLYAEEKIPDRRNDWSDYYSCYTYALLNPQNKTEDLTTALNDLARRQYEGLEDRGGFHLSAQLLTKIPFGPILSNAPNISLPPVAYYVLGGLALIIMLLASLNFTNLSVARALTRAKEIGVRKVTGARRKDLVYQFLSESMLTALFALVLALLFLVFLKPAFMGLWVNQHLQFDLKEEPGIYLIFFGFAAAIGLLAGVYPALHLSRYRPVKVLKHMESGRPGKLGMRKIISVTQFIVSLVFIVTSLLIYNQFRHFLAFDYGFDAKQIINISLQGHAYPLVAGELSTVPGVSEVSASEYVPATGTNNGNSLREAGSEDEYTYFISLPVDDHFIHNLDIELLAGENLPEADTSSSPFIVVNEAAAKAFGYEQPAEMVGLALDSEWSEEDLLVIGVVEDFRIDLPTNRDETRPMLLRNQPELFRYANVKVASPDLMSTVARLEEKWKSIDPVHPFQYEFYDQQLATTYQGILDVVAIVGFIAFLAIVIACLGLLGMAIYTTERRTKEIGIRKVLGAENFRIALLLSKGFLSILAVSVAIGAPISYFLNNLWLQNLPNRVSFGIGTVLIGTLLLLGLGLLTIGSQTIRAAHQNPVDTLRNE